METLKKFDHLLRFHFKVTERKASNDFKWEITLNARTRKLKLRKDKQATCKIKEN